MGVKPKSGIVELQHLLAIVPKACFHGTQTHLFHMRVLRISGILTHSGSSSGRLQLCVNKQKHLSLLSPQESIGSLWPKRGETADLWTPYSVHSNTMELNNCDFFHHTVCSTCRKYTVHVACTCTHRETEPRFELLSDQAWRIVFRGEAKTVSDFG